MPKARTGVRARRRISQPVRVIGQRWLGSTGNPGDSAVARAGARRWTEDTQLGCLRKRERGDWSGRPDSNRRHSAWEADTLPTELLPLEEAPGQAPCAAEITTGRPTGTPQHGRSLPPVNLQTITVPSRRSPALLEAHVVPDENLEVSTPNPIHHPPSDFDPNSPESGLSNPPRDRLSRDSQGCSNLRGGNEVVHDPSVGRR